MNICMLIVNKNRYSVVEYQYGVIKKIMRYFSVRILSYTPAFVCVNT